MEKKVGEKVNISGNPLKYNYSIVIYLNSVWWSIKSLGGKVTTSNNIYPRQSKGISLTYLSWGAKLPIYLVIIEFDFYYIIIRLGNLIAFQLIRIYLSQSLRNSSWMSGPNRILIHT